MNLKVMEGTDDGKILITFISLTLNTIKITYDQNLEFLTFMDFYVSQTSRSKRTEDLECKQPRETLLDKMTASDIASSILCYGNGIDVWMERFHMKQMNTAVGDAFAQTSTLKYNCPPGTKLKAYHDGWTQQGRDYYHELLEKIKGIKANKKLWEVMRDNWRMYLNKNKRGSFMYVAASMGGHNGAKMEDEDMFDEEDINHAHIIDLPDDDIED